jgi:DNA-binding LacI/PurR family transcriptional regulator
VDYLITGPSGYRLYHRADPHPNGKARLMGYRKALENIRLDERRIKYGDAGMTRGYELCKELIADGVPFSALFV